MSDKACSFGRKSNWLCPVLRGNVAAGALATELSTFVDACPKLEEDVATCGLGSASGSASFPIFEHSGERLYLLTEALLSEVVVCYQHVSKAANEIERAREMTDDAEAEKKFHPQQSREVSRKTAVDNALIACAAASKLLPKLRKEAGNS
ncbi:MAG: hypothetical protein ACE149_15240 [Armatimonadota bacterium]